MIYANYTTFIIALSLNIGLYIFISRRYLLKNYNKQAKEMEEILLQNIADKEKLIQSYDRIIYLSDKENLHLKDEIVQLQHQLASNKEEETIL